MNFFGPASARSYKISVVGNNWLVGNAVFSETALRIFLIFDMKLKDCKGREVTSCKKVTSCIKSTGEQVKPELTRQNTKIVDEGYRNVIQKSITTWAGKMHKRCSCIHVS